MKITKVTVTLEDGKELILPIQEQTVLKMYAGLENIRTADGWIESEHNDINPFFLYSARKDISQWMTDFLEANKEGIQYSINT